MKHFLLIIFSYSFLMVDCFAQKWSAVGTGLDKGSVEALAVYKDELYAGGFFDKAGDIPVNKLAKWNGKSWQPVGSGVEGKAVNGERAKIFALAVYKDELYAGGFFPKAGGVEAHSIAKWNGKTWSPLGNGIDGFVYSLAVYKDELYVAGQFSLKGLGYFKMGGKSINPGNSIAKWDGTKWSNVPGTEKISLLVNDMAVYKDELYIGGFFREKISDGIISNIVKFDGGKFIALGDGIDYKEVTTNIAVHRNQVNSLEVYKDELYIGGAFYKAGGIKVDNIVKWNGEKWSPVGEGSDGGVGGMTIYNEELYAVGSFKTVLGTGTSSISKWDGTNWTPLGGDVFKVVGAFWLSELAVYDDKIYVGGYFEKINKNPAKNIASYK